MMTEDPSTDTHNKEQQIITTNTHQQQETDKQKTQENTKKQLDCNDIELEIISKESNGWPDNIQLSHLVTGIEDGTYKFAYNEPTIEAHEVLDLIENGEITMHDCFIILEDSIFRKIRSGQIKERSPSSTQTQRIQTKESQ